MARRAIDGEGRYELFAIGSDVIVSRAAGIRLNESFDWELQRIAEAEARFCNHMDGHQLAAALIDNFLTVGRPERILAAAFGDLVVLAAGRIRLDINFKAVFCPRFVGL